MLRADQTAIINQANVHMASLRGSEILYFSQFFTSFGTQATLISVLVIGNLQQVPGLESENHFLWIHLFWLTSAIAFCSSIYVFICCFFISVYGQGLALRGPTGSMVKAVEGMVIEQKTIVTYFGVTLFFLGLHLIGTCGIMMSPIFAVTSSIIIIFGMFAWYTICTRVYNRFKFTEVTEDWDPENDDDNYSDYYDFDNNYSQRHDISNNSGENINLKGNTNCHSNKSRNSHLSNNSNNNKGHADGGNYQQSVIGANVNMQGYMSIVDYTSSSSSYNSKNKNNKLFPRKYFVLKNRRLYYYSNKEAYEFQSEQPLNKRPISFAGYSIDTEIIPVDNSNNNNNNNNNNNTSNSKNNNNSNITKTNTTTNNSNNIASGSATVYTLILTPPVDEIDYLRGWEFQCDSREELYQWKVALIEAFSLSNSFQYNNNNAIDSNNNDDNGNKNNSDVFTMINDYTTAIENAAESVLSSGVSGIQTVGKTIKRKSITAIKTTLIS